MTPEIYRKAAELFDRSLAASPHDPGTWLQSQADIPPDEAKSEALRLIQLHREAEAKGFLDEDIADHRAAWDQSPKRPLLTGKTLASGRYQVQELVGHGGMGEVYAAYDQELSQQVALKTLHSHLSSDGVSRERFRREVLLLREIQHPNVIRIYDFGRDGDLFFYTMELLDGETLAGRIAERGAFPELEIERIARGVLDGLDAVHDRGIVHRDIKPSNVFLTSAGRVVLMDFGIALASGQATLTKTEGILGSLDYMSPEQLQSDTVTKLSDFYSFGILLYELRQGSQPWTGTSPFSRATLRINQPKPAVTLPGALGRTVDACLQPSPARRPQSSAEIRALLEGKRSFPWRLLLSAAAVVLVCALAWIAWTQRTVTNPKVEQHLKLAAQFATRRTADDMANAQQEFEAAIRLDPRNAEAWTGLADVYSTNANFGFGDARVNLAKAAEAAEQASTLAPNSGAAHAVHAYVVSLDLAKWRTAGPMFERAVSLDPRQTRVRLWYGAFLGKIGRFDDAMSQLNAGLEIDPGSMTLNQQLVAVHTARRDLKAAVVAAERLVRLHPREPSSHLALCNSLLNVQKLDMAQASCEEAVRQDSGPSFQATLAAVYAAQGKLAEAKRIATAVEGRLRNVSIQVDLYGRLGETEKAMKLVEGAFAAGDSTVQLIGYSPRFDWLKHLPRFQKIRAALGFVDRKS